VAYLAGFMKSANRNKNGTQRNENERNEHFLNNAYYQESYILIIEYSSVVTVYVAEWLDGNFER
jgi:hypothetical protein